MNLSKNKKAKSKPAASKPAVAAKPSKSAKVVASAPAKPVKSAKPVKAVAKAAPARREITTDCVASRAYILWEQAGRPQGRDVEHWLQAESQIKQDSQSFAA